MKKLGKKLRNKGFSLIELMIVVAIIGILASIAIPNFQKFQAKSRQSEAKADLTAIFTSESAFSAEYQSYTADFVAMGYAPNGVFRYNHGFTAAGNKLPSSFQGSCGAGANCAGGAAATGFAVDKAPFNCQNGTPATPNPWTAGNVNGACAFNNDNGTVKGAAIPAITSAGNVTSTNGSIGWGAGASGYPLLSTAMDTWTIDQTKDLTNNLSGI
jgi:type IV pilus assembly protein PilA